MTHSRKHIRKLLVLAAFPAAVFLFFVIPTFFFSLTVDLSPAEAPAKIILSNFNGEDEQYLEITDADEINRVISLFDNLYIFRVSSSAYTKYNPFRRAPGNSIYRKIIFEYDDGFSFFYRFDYNRIERGDKTYWLLGDRLGSLIEMLDKSGNS